MAQSLNTKVIFTTKANVFVGWIGNKHGDILVGDRAFEFYNEKIRRIIFKFLGMRLIKYVRNCSLRIVIFVDFLLIRNLLDRLILL